MLTLLYMLACTTEETFPDQFARTRYEVDEVDDAGMRYQAFGNEGCEQDLTGYDTDQDTGQDEREAIYRDLMDPCTFDKEQAKECLKSLRSLHTCQEALGAMAESNVGHYLFESCALACGVPIEG